MRAFVLDASLAMEWFTTTASAEALAKRALFDERVAVVPHLWRFEVMNVVTTWLARGDASPALGTRILHDLLQLPLAIVDEGDPAAVVALASAQRLTAYDATYLHLAMLTGEPLATLDRSLITAAGRVGVTCL